MKTASLLSIAVYLSVLMAFSSRGQETNHIHSNININMVNVPPATVLDVYKQTTGLELVIASDVRGATHGFTLHFSGSPEAVSHSIEQALLKEDGIVITRLDNKQASVTYNDKLKLQS
jgi:hypothetical protein